MTVINATQQQELTFLTGITNLGAIAQQSFWTWNNDDPATYSSSLSYEAKWGAPVAGTAGTIYFAFDSASNWTATETAAFLSAMHLWSAEANITFSQTSQSAASVVISRAHDGTAQGGITLLDTGSEGSTQLGHALKGNVQIDTAVAGFGPIGASFATGGGYPWQTILHELGHVIGLGHGGAYDEGTTTTTPAYTSYDNTAFTIMSYIDADQASDSYAWGTSGGYARSPTTPMLLDILAAERIYGMPVNSPLSGGQVFGFHANIPGDIQPFFDFSINTKPVVTLFDTGTGNTLDLSGYSVASNVDLHDGAFSSVGGLSDNVAIAYGTRIDAAIGGTGADALHANDDGDILMGGAGADILIGGAGNDHIYGNMSTTTQGSTDGDDTISAGDGSNYVNGNAGNDHITAGWGTNRLYGGAGNDQITVSGGGNNHLNGNLGDDILQVAGGVNDIHGGQGNDTIEASDGSNYSFGEVGNDVISGGAGIDVMTGGPGSDLFLLDGPANSVSGSWDEISDYLDGTDKFHVDLLPNGSALAIVHAGQTFGDEGSAAAYAQSLLSGAVNTEAAALQVGADTYLFYTAVSSAQTIDEVVKLDQVSATTIDTSDFVSATTHL